MINALLNLGRLDEAIEECQGLRQLPLAPLSGEILYARLLILKNLSLPSMESRQWNDVIKILEPLRKANPNVLEVDVLLAEVRVGQGKFEEAQEILEKAKEKAPQDVEPWIALAAVAGREGKVAGALKILDSAGSKFGDLAELRQARLRFLPVKKEEALVFLRPLADGLDRFSRPGQTRLLPGLADAFERAGDMKKAEECWQRLGSLEKNRLKVHLAIFDFYLRQENLDGMAKTLEAIEALESKSGPLGHYGHAQVLIFRASRGEKGLTESARDHLNVARTKRPRWARIPESLATLAEMDGNGELAVEHLREAVALGSRQLHVVRALVMKLMERRQYGEADNALRKLQEAGPISNYLQKLAAEVSVFNQNMDRATYLAELAVSGHAKDYQDYLWHGQILGVMGKYKEAEESLREAIKQAGEDIGPWIVLVQLQSSSGDSKKAAAVIEEMKAKVSPSKLSFALGQCYQAVGDRDKAEKAFQEALSLKPDDLVTLQSFVKFYLNNGKPKDAEPYLRQVLDAKMKASPEQKIWARRSLALAHWFSSPGR